VRVLAGAAIGAGLVIFSGGIGWWISEQQRPRQMLVLTYTKPGGTMRPVSPERASGDPTHFTIPATRYTSFIASRCRLRQWTSDTNANANDVEELSTLSTPAAILSDRQFNCLTSFVKPGYVTLTRTTL